ncbi:dehydrogenase [Geomicrobium sp. JCM 19037]|uniref:SDR family NAD(P)-dependent oxidoreductase n=1 Tax=Geomicrobium sp. JCM 19037 TaxID=1460634 RepID=UPI00045F1A7D|nr:SDR family NAD(P)-dependent oxidoreductase [Geomicrobium sp. JCM 19037]GAK05438.1 dehydrogenase [Geomicrobium sp. JCM 19037]
MRRKAHETCHNYRRFQRLRLALTHEYLAENAFVHALSRSSMQVKDVHHYEIDLTNVDALNDTFTAIFEQIDASCTELILINNAGMVEPVGTVIENTPASLEKSVTLNLTAPMAASSLFLQKSQHLNVKKTVLNISSGAGRSPMEGWSAYCSGKAGLDMFTRAAAAEQSEETNLCSFCPSLQESLIRVCKKRYAAQVKIVSNMWIHSNRIKQMETLLSPRQ